jgi:ABC-type multidrug transport system permease subunit
MKRIAGILVAAVYAVITFLAFRNSADGWAGGHTDLGFWWAVIGGFLAIAGMGALVGTLLHTRRRNRSLSGG